MTQLVSAGAEIDEDVSRNLEEAEFNGFDKNSNVDEETRKKERRMSAIRALNAKRQAKLDQQIMPESACDFGGH